MPKTKAILGLKLCAICAPGTVDLWREEGERGIMEKMKGTCAMDV